MIQTIMAILMIQTIMEMLMNDTDYYGHTRLPVTRVKLSLNFESQSRVYL